VIEGCISQLATASVCMWVADHQWLMAKILVQYCNTLDAGCSWLTLDRA